MGRSICQYVCFTASAQADTREESRNSPGQLIGPLATLVLAVGNPRLRTSILRVRRAKNGTSATHPLICREMRELRRHQRECLSSPFVFVSERGAPLSAPGFSRLVERAVAVADLGIKAHAHMLRHACGYKLANDGHDTRAIQAYLGHRNIQNTTRYTALAPQRFKEFFRD